MAVSVGGIVVVVDVVVGVVGGGGGGVAVRGCGGDVLVVVGSDGVISGCEWYGCRWTVICVQTRCVRQ